MKENIILIAALIIVGTTIWIVGSLIVGAVVARKNRRRKEDKEKDLCTLKLDMKNGDQQAKIKLQQQLLHFEERFENAKDKARRAEEEFNNFKRILDIFDPELQEEMQTVKLPKNLTRLSYDEKGKDDHVFLYGEELEEYFKAQEEIIEQ